ncbi:MAG TPA: GlsB/YeaQ/YmgE family stress response membrane protein [Anaerolineales bacterium]|nr:GlsB/YeaQ/YmgE family stress response membrane protein [Anaerolineales bacterium]
MGWFAAIVVGLISGWLVSKLMKTKTGLWLNLLLGVAGSMVGGWVAGLLTGVDMVTGINLTSILVSVLGAIIVVYVYRFFKKN